MAYNFNYSISCDVYSGHKTSTRLQTLAVVTIFSNSESWWVEWIDFIESRNLWSNNHPDMHLINIKILCTNLLSMDIYWIASTSIEV